MQTKFYLQLRQAVSHERLDAYRLRGASGDDADLFAHYAWNIALSESLYSPLQCLEVSLRNSINDAASSQFNTDAWFDLPGILLASETDKVNDARSTLAKSGKPLDSGRVVAELNFGFWTSLFDVRYEQKLWPVLLKAVVPNMPRSIRVRKNLSKRFNRIRILRNRIFHHEPIWHWRDLSLQHDEIIEAVNWISPAMKSFAETFDKFPEVYKLGISEYHRSVSALGGNTPEP